MSFVTEQPESLAAAGNPARIGSAVATRPAVAGACDLGANFVPVEQISTQTSAQVGVVHERTMADSAWPAAAEAVHALAAR
ncbi:hypothetical protein A9W99_09805 [Mycobacterium sp. 1164966.3]|uniref:hypothetical protein n=1 Tax=Mycobacterium sp. 1164966.3 TaxID=1856861 RepID=UPI0007FD2180|nr:hypothetical protein [Mycobacterium sp. 1164966.3]OBA82852.1 hypothetical protein A9W99_09805 [Mycobacterium sp. 1164966.3]